MDWNLLKSHKIHHLFWNLKVLCHVQKILQVSPIFSKLNPVYILAPHLFQINFTPTSANVKKTWV
jgi:hypothetical protein